MRRVRRPRYLAARLIAAPAVLAGVAVVVLAGCSAQSPTNTASPTAVAPPVVAASPSAGVSGHALFAPSPERLGITREQAIAIARTAAPRWSSAAVLEATTGTFGDLGSRNAPILVSPAPGPERAVWRIKLGVVRGPADAAGTDVIIDAIDGTVIETTDWISIS